MRLRLPHAISSPIGVVPDPVRSTAAETEGGTFAPGMVAVPLIPVPAPSTRGPLEPASSERPGRNRTNS